MSSFLFLLGFLLLFSSLGWSVSSRSRGCRARAAFPYAKQNVSDAPSSSSSSSSPHTNPNSNPLASTAQTNLHATLNPLSPSPHPSPLNPEARLTRLDDDWHGPTTHMLYHTPARTHAQRYPTAAYTHTYLRTSSHTPLTRRRVLARSAVDRHHVFAALTRCDDADAPLPLTHAHARSTLFLVCRIVLIVIPFAHTYSYFVFVFVSVYVSAPIRNTSRSHRPFLELVVSVLSVWR